MAVGIRVKGIGWTTDQVERLNQAIRPDGEVPDGLLFHASGPVDGGVEAIDYWESRAQFDRFAEEHIGPAAAAVGITSMPEVTEFPVTEYFPS